MKNIVLIYGGQSTEHGVSCQSALGVLQAIDHSKYDIDLIYISREGEWYLQPKLIVIPNSLEELYINKEELFDFNLLRKYDVAVPILHGKRGEDGSIQGLFELFNVNYVGNGIFSSAVAIDKVLTKKFCETLDIPQVPYVTFSQKQWKVNKDKWLFEIGNLEYPVFVKPPTLGSSIGITKAENHIEVEQAINLAFYYGDKVLIEKAVNAREIEIGALGNGNTDFSLIGEIVIEDEYYDYDSKYSSDKTKLVIPAPIPIDIEQKVEEYATRIYSSLECKGLARLDFFLEESGELYFNEINTFPGFTSKSMYPQLWQKSGVSFPQLLDRLINLASENASLIQVK